MYVCPLSRCASIYEDAYAPQHSSVEISFSSLRRLSAAGGRGGECGKRVKEAGVQEGRVEIQALRRCPLDTTRQHESESIRDADVRRSRNTKHLRATRDTGPCVDKKSHKFSCICAHGHELLFTPGNSTTYRRSDAATRSSKGTTDEERKKRTTQR